MCRMRMINLVFAVFLLVSFVVCIGCATGQERTYSDLAKTFFRLPTKQQQIEFRQYDMEKQYEVYICGNQYIHPPAIYLARTFALRGESLSEFLVEKFQQANDETVRDITLVFSEMSRQKTYDVAADSELMRLLTNRIDKVKDDFWRNLIKEDMVKEILKNNPSGNEPTSQPTPLTVPTCEMMKSDRASRP